MTTVYRISKKDYIRDLSGYGAKTHGGRWNRPGVSVLYTSQAKSLAMLELIVHFSAKKALQQHYQFASISFDESKIEELDFDLPNVDLYRPNNELLWNILDYHFFNKNIMVLKVPSILVPGEFNFLLNPIHEDFNEVKLVSTENAIVDERFLDIL